MMKSRSKSRQGGVSLTGLIFILAILGLFAVLGMKVVPAITEYFGVKKAIVAAKSSGTTPQEIRTSFDKNAEIGYIKSVTGKDLDITQVNGVTEVSFEYAAKIPLVGPASLVFDFAGSTAPQTLAKKKPAP